MKWADPPVLSGYRQPLEADARPRQRREGSGGDRVQQRQLRERLQVGCVHGEPDLQDPLHGEHVDRPRVLRRRRDEERRADLHQHAERIRHEDEHQDGARQGDGHVDAGEPDPPHLLRGLERVRAGGAVQRREPGGGDHVGARRQAGAPAVHALGHARLGQLRPGGDGRHPRGCRREGQPHRVRVHRLQRPLLLDAGGRAAGDRERGVLDHGRRRDDDQRLAVLDPEPEGDREAPAAAEQLLQVDSSCGRRETRRPRSPRSRRSTSWRTWPRWIRSRSASRTSPT